MAMEKKTYADMRSNWEFGEASECRKGLMCGMGYTVEEQKRLFEIVKELKATLHQKKKEYDI